MILIGRKGVVCILWISFLNQPLMYHLVSFNIKNTNSYHYSYGCQEHPTDFPVDVWFGSSHHFNIGGKSTEPCSRKINSLFELLNFKRRYIYIIVKAVWWKTYYIFQSVSRQTAHQVFPFRFPLYYLSQTAEGKLFTYAGI